MPHFFKGGIMNDVLTMARTIYGEARGESRLGKIAVACVILNRYKAKKWFAGKTIAETCTFCVKGSKYHQFSCWNDDDPNKKKIENMTAVQLGECYEVAEKVINGEIKDIVGGACHYHTVNLSPAWARGKKPDFKIGNHLFYCGIE